MGLPIIIEMAEAYSTTEKISIRIVCATVPSGQLAISILDEAQQCIDKSVVSAKGNVYEHQFDEIDNPGMYSVVVTNETKEEANTSFLVTEKDAIPTEIDTQKGSKRIVGMKLKRNYDFGMLLQFIALGFVFGTMGAMISGAVVSTSALSGLACSAVSAIFSWVFYKRNRD